MPLSFTNKSKVISSLLFLALTISCGLNKPRLPNIPEGYIRPDKPNIILILTDDQAFHTMEYMPTLMEELVGKGINFTNGFVTTPVCCPSRASILTGQYAHNHKVRANVFPAGSALKFDDSVSLGTWMQDLGYQTALIGKYMNGYNKVKPRGVVPKGWDEWQVFLRYYNSFKYSMYYEYDISDNGEIVKFGTQADDYSTDMMTRKSVDFIRQNWYRPFFLFYSSYAPHSPHLPAERHMDLFEDVPDYTPPNFMEEDLSDKPEWVRKRLPKKRQNIRERYVNTLRSLMAVDEGIAKILETLDEIEQRENTVIVFLSDNGLTYGEHTRVNSKGCPHEECVKVPFVIYYPEMIQTPRQDDRLVLNIDLAPTFIELAGGQIPESVDGISLIPLMKDKAEEWRDAVLFEQWSKGRGYQTPTMFSVRTSEWKYVDYKNGEQELYDLVNDPWELENLANGPGYEEIIENLAERLEQLRAE